MFKKPIRIFTKRYNEISKNTFEAIEINENGIMTWIAEEDFADKDLNLFASFPVDIDFVKDLFEKNNRTLDISRLPSHTILHPYGII